MAMVETKEVGNAHCNTFYDKVHLKPFFVAYLPAKVLVSVYVLVPVHVHVHQSMYDVFSYVDLLIFCTKVHNGFLGQILL